jgi:AcrR family transcriptional regulator
VLEVLKKEGLVEARRGSGTVVTARPTEGQEGGRRREPAPALSRDDVVRAAVRLADDEGITGLSMRRVASALDVPTMSIYRHVRSRDDLVTSMIDTVYAENPLPKRLPDGWRARAELSARTLWSAFNRHPWAAQVMSLTRPQIAPHGMAHTEALLGAFDSAARPLDMDTRMHLAVSVFQLVRGVAEGIEPAVAARQDTGLTDEEWMDRMLPDLRAAIRPDLYPHLAKVTASEVDLTLDSLFEFSLARLLDGYAAFLGDAR